MSTGTDAAPRWQAALAAALVGEILPLPEPGRPEVARLVVDLERAGWPAERITAHARAQTAAGQGWPHLIPPEIRAGCGAAQLQAALTCARELLGLAVIEIRKPSRRTRLDADEQRLLREVPPHHGS